jgi:hypothetical protein
MLISRGSRSYRKSARGKGKRDVGETRRKREGARKGVREREREREREGEV